MNKKLLVGAIGAAIAAGPIMAQAEVKLYGHAHMSLDVIDQDTDPLVPGADDGGLFVSSNSSRFGMRASEDLGGGLKGTAQFELFLTQDENNDVTSNRDNYVGLEGGFGALRLGHVASATKDIGGIADLFYREQLGESRAIINEAGSDSRVANGVHYISPKLGAGTIKVNFGADEGGEDNVIGVNYKWSSGPLAFGVGLLNDENSAAEDTQVLRAAVKFALGGGLTVAGLWQDISAIGGIDGADRSALGVGASFKTGNNVLKAQYYVADEIDGAPDTGGSQISIGWDHLFSKTTIAYVTYAATSNDDNANFDVGGVGHATVVTNLPDGGDSSGLSAGMIINF